MPSPDFGEKITKIANISELEPQIEKVTDTKKLRFSLGNSEICGVKSGGPCLLSLILAENSEKMGVSLK